MDRSLGFGSTSHNYFALFRLAFASAPELNSLTSLCNVTRRSVLQKVRDQTFSRPLSACKRMVSGSLSLPSRGSFHLSLTVLYSIGHQVVFSLRRWASFLPTGFLVSCGTLDSHYYFKVSPTRLSLPSVSLSKLFDYSFITLRESLPRIYFYIRFGLFPVRSPLLRKSFLLSFPPGT